MTELTTELLPILQLDDAVVLPGLTVPLAIEGDNQHAAVAAPESGNRRLLLAPRNGGTFSAIGTVAQLVESGKLPTGADVSILQGLHRARIGSGQSDIGGALWVQVEPLPDGDPTDSARELAREYRALIESLLESRGASRVIEAVRSVRHPGQLADLSGYSPDLTVEQRLTVLETLDIEDRLTQLIAWTEDNEGMEKTQRDYLLRQQMEAIKKQLGEGGDNLAAGYRARLEDAGMPDLVRKEVEREIDRFEATSEQNPEHGWIRTYLDWIFEIPWNVRSEDNFDLTEARRVLDADHTGLEDVKDRILEFLAVRKLRHERGLTVSGGRGSGAIITLVGPPGVGKTSLGESVAHALGRKFARVSLGGIHDEAEIRGHRRTYVGALPGRIVRALKEAGTKNPVIMLDEIDKVGSDWRGDPSSALLEVLDPAQNNTFRDHYLEVDLDLSEVLFIPTANVWETIPGPLLDRMELIRLDGYTENEKVAIARDHLLRRQVEQAGLTGDEVTVTDEAILAVITDHTREAGVRNLERELGKMTRKVATRIATGALVPPLEITPVQVRELLGKPKFDNEVAERTAVAGVATGLAVTGTGGDVLFIEAANAPGDGTLTLTGQLGDVMKESAQIALSYIRAHAADLGVDQAAAEKSFHVHVPAGAVPKDGPSAGIAMTTAMVSLLAAHRMGLTEVILPKRNEKDIDDVPESVRNEMTIHFVSRVEQAVNVALEARSGALAAA